VEILSDFSSERLRTDSPTKVLKFTEQSDVYPKPWKAPNINHNSNIYTMKKIAISSLVMLVTQTIFGQISGNVNYHQKFTYPTTKVSVRYPNKDLFTSVRGMTNVKADIYTAIFSVTQVGKTTEEVNALIDTRIEQATANFKDKERVEIYVDMISFVPAYAFHLEKRLFSKRNYNEIPTGFELKKNIHIKYKNPIMLNKIISSFAKAEIYDLVRVDYYSTKLESVKKELREKAKLVLKDKLKHYEQIMFINFDTLEIQLSDAYKIEYPIENYQSYTAYNSSSLNLRKRANDISKANKSKTLYYQPIMNKDFDFVQNPVVLEPVIQVMYEMKVTIKKQTPTEKEYILISPNGELKQLNIK